MWISSLFQTGIRKLFILGLVSSLAACGGGGGGGKKPSPVPASASPISSSSSSLLSSSVSSSVSSSISSSSLSSLNISSTSSVSSASSIISSSISSQGNSSSSSISSVIVVPTDTTPDSFSFSAVTGAALSASVTSAVITISGINTASPISIAGGQYSINGGVATSAAGTITNGQTVVVSLTASATPNTTTQAILTVGGVAQTFAVTSVLADITPDIFSFTAVTGAPLNLPVTSQAITVSGINAAAPISIAGGEYSIDGGAFTSTSGTVRNSQTVAVKLISATTVETETRADITIGGITSSFLVTTTAVQLTPLNIAGVVTTFAGTPPGADGIGAAARFQYPTGSVSDGTYLYVADTHNHKIRKIEIATGVVTTFAGSGLPGDADGTGIAASFNEPKGITISGAHLYVTDYGSFKIRKIEIATGMVTSLAVSAGVFFYPTGIATDGTYLYVADSYHNKIRKIDMATNIVTTLAGSGDWGEAVDGTGTDARFWYPSNIVIDGTHLYVADSNNNKIRKIDLVTGTVTTVAGIKEPDGITTDGSYLYVTEFRNHKISKIDMATGIVTALAGGDSSGSADGTGITASFNYPAGITIDGAHLYVADSANHKIRKIEIATSVVTTLAGRQVDSSDGTGAAASFHEPTGIATDGAYFYVTDSGSHKIRKIEIATGVVATLAGSGSQGSADGTAAVASFYYPSSIATDGTYLYVTDAGNNKIRKIVIATGIVTTLAGSGSQGSADGTGAVASFNHPSGITTDGTHLYVADTHNHKIRQIDIATGVVTTLAGNGTGDGVDGIGIAAGFRYPYGITSDGVYLYVADSYNHKIRKIAIATGVVTTLAGGSVGSADGTGAAAGFFGSEGITTDGTYLYIADTQNNKIRQIEIATGVVTTLAGSDSEGIDDGVGAAAKFRKPSGITTDGFALFVTDTENNTIRKIE